MADDATGDSRGRAGASSGSASLRLAALVVSFVVGSTALHLSGWSGPQRLQTLVESAGWALFGWWWGAVLAWAGALLGAYGGFVLGRRLGRPAVDRLLRGRLEQADQVLARHGLVAVLAVRLVPLFPFTPLNYASGLLGVRLRDYVLGTAVGIVPGALAYAAVGASGADPRGIVAGVGGLLVLTLLGGTVGRRLLATSARPAPTSES